MIEDARRAQIDRFVMEQIDSVPHLEALLLLFGSRPHRWSAEEMAGMLYVRTEAAAKILEGLETRGIITGSANLFTCDPQSEEAAANLRDLDAIYRKEVIRISSMIHAKAPPGVLDFARAFRIKKDKE